MRRRTFKNKLTAIIATTALCLCSLGVSADQPMNINDFLLEAGFPQRIIDTMSEVQKELVYENSQNKTVKFAGYETQDFVVDDEKLSPVETRGGLISSSDLTISVLGTYTMNSSGSILYSTVYPSFVWKKPVKVKNDSFSMAMYSGWEAIPGAENLRLHLLNSSGQSAQYVDLNPATSHSAGYSYKVPSNTGAVQALYAGYAHYDIEKKSSSASPRISLHYVHDKSSSLNISYSINIGFGGISITVNNNNLYEMSGNYTVNGLA